MEFTFKRTATIVAALLLIAAMTQAVYTALYIAKVDVPRQLLWGGEALLFTVLAAFAGSALAQAKRLHLVWAAITAAAVLNVVQVGVGLTMFGTFREASTAVPDISPATAGVVAFSFMVYNAAKVLLALALIAGSLHKGKALGVVGAVIGLFALVTNTASMAAGRGVFGPDLPLAGGSGVLATVLLAVCLFSLAPDEQ